MASLNKDLLGRAIEYVKNKELRKFIKDFLENYVPEYFWTIPASSSGKYHPEDTRSECGLIRHIKYTIQIARTLFKYVNFTNDEKDTILTALLLHDCFKLGYESSSNKYTTHDHPIICQNEILEWLEFNDYEDKPLVTDLKTRKEIAWLAELIGTHMGKFTTGPDWAKRYNNETYITLRNPKTGFEIFTHLCDYVSSKLHLFDDNKVIEELEEVSELIGISGDQLKSCHQEFINIK